jgi:hypothetical protein
MKSNEFIKTILPAIVLFLDLSESGLSKRKFYI